MALRSNKTTIPAATDEISSVDNTTPEETQVDQAVAVAQAKEKARLRVEAQEKAAADKAAKTETAVAVSAPAGALSTSVVPAPSIASLHNALNPADIGTAFKRIVASNGGCEESSSKVDLGKYMDVQVLSVSTRYMIVPVADDKDKTARKFCRCSYDGETIFNSDGDTITIEEYIESVSDKYPEFQPIKKYSDVFGLILHTADKNFEETAKGWGIVQISVSPTAIQSLNSYSMQTKLFIARGQLPIEKQNCIRVNAVKKSNDSNSWTVFEFGLVPAEDMETCSPIAM
jgi:hypothetical protein